MLMINSLRDEARRDLQNGLAVVKTLRLNCLEKQAPRIPIKEVKHEEPKNARYLRYLAVCSFDDSFRGRYKFTTLCAW